MEYACQGNVVSINCDSDSNIHIINANYGRLGKELCPDNIGTENIECVFSGTLDIVTEM